DLGDELWCHRMLSRDQVRPDKRLEKRLPLTVAEIAIGCGSLVKYLVEQTGIRWATQVHLSERGPDGWRSGFDGWAGVNPCADLVGSLRKCGGISETLAQGREPS